MLPGPRDIKPAQHDVRRCSNSVIEVGLNCGAEGEGEERNFWKEEEEKKKKKKTRRKKPRKKNHSAVISCPRPASILTRAEYSTTRPRRPAQCLKSILVLAPSVIFARSRQIKAIVYSPHAKHCILIFQEAAFRTS